MQVIFGQYKGKKLKVPQNKSTRPTLQRAKETMFNIIPHHFEPGIVVDVFAGSGQLGIEAISRGATFLIANETNFQTRKVLQDNLSVLPKNTYKITNFDYEIFFSKIKIKKIDYIIVDPPYSFAKEAIKKILKIIDKKDLLNKKGFIIGEMPRNEEIDFKLNNLRLKKINLFSKITKMWVYEKI